MKKDIILKAENISKQYRLGEVGTGTLTHDLNKWWHQIRGKENPYLKIGDTNDRSTKGTSEYVWALQDINFEVERGEVLGIIGKNGAGKSTLLKILSKVTAPTTGSIKSRGRIASLLEVGTGFHGEMTGRENIFLNGAILGMTKKEIASKLDEIIEFSGCERYIDTPVKRYSSGMTVRLAFAVAAFLEPEILVIDEVLAVGDAEFQKKAIGKMQDISRGEGRTVLFVSHNMAAVKSLCTRGVILEHGKVVFEGEIENAVSYYLGGNTETMNSRTFGHEYDFPVFKLIEISLKNYGRNSDDVLRENELIILNTKLDIKINEPERYHITYHLHNEMGEAMFSFSNAGSFSLKNGINDITCNFPISFFQSGQYFLSLFIVEDSKQPIFIESDVIAFTVVDAGRELGTYMGREPGYIRPQFEWKIE
ncbi:lipopolysaccharide transport system ATP-binding protein [Flavobacterium sp. CF108]|uniref:ABC transporter ATP-binding protein n=1 Tax=unclassified Flavobacterium TaxID=196869 RepID=UPI0008CCB0AE|nr:MULTISPECIES: ABC transporter ATP-binding protein [unclassified Flavobacterium]SEO49580.1 lipopolysaccharide transport system ATP-binding protein [Flavobacterium sp. fv08]SHH72234.1 lipopolysaccharide transport system ATP-binding protein [Flavobacterium sp. CF108]